MACFFVRAARSLGAPALMLAVVFGSCAFVAVPRSVSAQADRDSLAPGAHSEAEHHFRMGKRLFLNRKYAHAAREFTAAQRYARDSAVLAFHKGRALERSGDLDGAIIGYESYLNRRPAAPDRTEVERLIGVVRARAEAGKLLVSVDTEPPGARVYIDSGSPDDGPSGLSPMAMRLHPGAHRFYIELEGHEPVDRVIELHSLKSLRFRLAKFDTPAILTIGGMDTDTEGAPVFIDGIKRGVVPATVELGPGAHIVEVAKEGFVTWIAEYSLRRGQRLHIDMVLDPEYERMMFDRQLRSKLVATSLPSGAEVLLDGRSYGVTPADMDDLVPGTHTLRMQLGQESVLRSITLAPDAAKRFHHTFEAAATMPLGPPVEEGSAQTQVAPKPLVTPKGPPTPTPTPPPTPTGAEGADPPAAVRPILTVATLPADAGARVEIDGELGGIAPWTGPVDEGRRAILIQAPGFETVIRDVLVPARSEVSVTVPLRAESASAFASAPAVPPSSSHRPRLAGSGVTARATPDRPLPARDRPGRTWIAGLLASSSDERRTSRFGEVDSSSDAAKDGVRLGAAIRWAKFLSDQAELGLAVDIMLADTRPGSGEQLLGVGPFLRMRLPIRDERGEWGEVYAMAGGGLSATHADEDIEGGKISAVGFGWNVGWAGGVQIGLSKELALFADAGWRRQGLGHDLDELGGAPVDLGSYDRSWSEVIVAIGVTYHR